MEMSKMGQLVEKNRVTGGSAAHGVILAVDIRLTNSHGTKGTELRMEDLEDLEKVSRGMIDHFGGVFAYNDTRRSCIILPRSFTSENREISKILPLFAGYAATCVKDRHVDLTFSTEVCVYNLITMEDLKDYLSLRQAETFKYAEEDVFKKVRKEGFDIPTLRRVADKLYKGDIWKLLSKFKYNVHNLPPQLSHGVAYLYVVDKRYISEKDYPRRKEEYKSYYDLTRVDKVLLRETYLSMVEDLFQYDSKEKEVLTFTDQQYQEHLKKAKASLPWSKLQVKKEQELKRTDGASVRASEVQE
jgi:hypothetical protein